MDSNSTSNLRGLTAIVTSGPTYEAIDPVRFIANRSSGKQGHAIAKALAYADAEVTLVTGPVCIPDPGVKTIHVESAHEMLTIGLAAMPADIVICAAAVSDFRPHQYQEHKIKKRRDNTPPTIELTENPDILKAFSYHQVRPRLVIGFAAETENLFENAHEKLVRKGCDWILANDVSSGKIFGAEENHVYLVTRNGITEWPPATKEDIAQMLVKKIVEHVHS